MGKTYDIEIPYLLTGPARGRITVSDQRLHGSEAHFIRFDLYPLIAPSHMRRHYGWWDIPLKHITREGTNFIFDFRTRVIRLDNREIPVEIMQGWHGPIEEDGYCMLHLSLWDGAQEPPHMIEVKSQPLVIATHGFSLPLKQINIPITDRCNLRCTMCPRQNTEGLIEVDIPEDALLSLLKTSGKLSGILLQGLGEPLLYKNIFNVIAQLKHGMHGDSEVGLTTNATMLDEDTGRKLLDSGLDFLYFSVDAAAKETYEAIRVGADFDSVVRNIGRFVQSRGAMGIRRPRLMMNFVITQQNLHEIGAFAGLARELGIENVTFSHCLGAESGRTGLVDKVKLKEQFEAVLSVTVGNGLNVYLPPLEKAREEKCFFMERAVVLAQGDVVPCHAMAPGYSTNKRRRIFGNAREKPLEQIWEQEDFKEFRYRVLQGDFPSECTGCECKAYLVL
jgi:radical SAM protein with 4Fe4S-binding SPASM domain